MAREYKRKPQERSTKRSLSFRLPLWERIDAYSLQHTHGNVSLAAAQLIERGFKTIRKKAV